MIFFAMAALQLGLGPSLETPPCPSDNLVRQVEICSDPPFSAADRALTALGARPGQARAEACQDQACIRGEYEAAMTAALRRTKAASVLRRAKPAGELRLLQTEPDWIMVQMDFTNWTKPRKGAPALRASHDGFVAMAHLEGGRAEAALGGCRVVLTPNKARSSWAVSTFRKCVWAAKDLSPAGDYGGGRARERSRPPSGR
jgi:hypothetical protein